MLVQQLMACCSLRRVVAYGVLQVIESMFDTISGKEIAMFGFAFKKDAGDTTSIGFRRY